MSTAPIPSPAAFGRGYPLVGRLDARTLGSPSAGIRYVASLTGCAKSRSLTMTEDVAGLVLPIDETGVVYVPGPGGAAVPRSYAVLENGKAYLLNSTGLTGNGADGEHSPFEPVPVGVREALREQYKTRFLSFPDQSSSEAVVSEARPGLLWVDPMRINLVYGRADIRKIARHDGEVLGGDWDTPHRQTFGELDVVRGLREHFVDGVAWQETDFYRRVVRAIEKGVHKWGCQDVGEFDQRLEGLEHLYEEIRDHGYRTQEDLGTDEPRDEIRVGIRRDGRFIFFDGRHRLAIARLLGLRQIPVRVSVRHTEWEEFKQRIAKYASKRAGRVYQLIDHPDLIDMPAHHGLERIGMIRESLQGYVPTGKKRLLDIGTHWGYMAQQMERFGFDVTAVEANKTCARFAEEIRVATESNFTVWQGSIFDYPDAEQHDAVVAVSIFHHFIKTEELHQQLVAFLERLSIDLMIFEPHLNDPPGQMRGAYRNYPPQEFAGVVAKHARLSTVEHIGTAPDGRPLYKLTR
jgi:hypothetical protein